MSEYVLDAEEPAVRVGQIGGIVIEVVACGKSPVPSVVPLMVRPAFKMTSSEAHRHGVSPESIGSLVVTRGPEKVLKEVMSTFLPGEDSGRYAMWVSAKGFVDSGGSVALPVRLAPLRND